MTVDLRRSGHPALLLKKTSLPCFVQANNRPVTHKKGNEIVVNAEIKPQCQPIDLLHRVHHSFLHCVFDCSESASRAQLTTENSSANSRIPYRKKNLKNQQGSRPSNSWRHVRSVDIHHLYSPNIRTIESRRTRWDENKNFTELFTSTLYR